MSDELRTAIWASALVRRAQATGASAFVARKGDPDFGAVLVKVATLDGRARLLSPARDGDGARVFHDVTPADGDEREVDAAAAARLSRDPDLWLIEIEDKAGRHHLTEPVR